MNEEARHFLETYAGGGEVKGGWLFAKALQQAQLDYSDRSLERLGQLLSAIRDRAKPSREVLHETPEGRNFCSLLAYYVIEVARRRTGANIDWHDRNSALRILPSGIQLPDGPVTRLIANALDQGAAFMPLAWLESQMLGEKQATSAGDYVASLIASLERNGPAAWSAGMFALGRIASYQMMMAADGGSVRPMMLSSTAPQTWVVLMAGFPGEDIDAALDGGAHKLNDNPGGAIWQVLSYDGFMEVNGGRVDAVMVILHTYGKLPLRLKIAFPYRPAGNGRPFAILDPRLREANIENEQVAMLNRDMERGIQSVKWVFGTTWDQLREVEMQSDVPPVNTASTAQSGGDSPFRPEMEQAMAKLRSAYAQTQKRLNPAILASISASRPPWMNRIDALNEVLERQELLYKEGEIVWGALIQANKLLFSAGRDDCPALLVYSRDPYFDGHPHELRQIGHKIFALKDTTPSDPALRGVARLVSDELERSMNFKLPQVFSSRDIRAAAFMVFRKHIPNGVLTAGLLPILTHPSTEAVMIVPFEFWPIEVVIMWKEGKL